MSRDMQIFLCVFPYLLAAVIFMTYVPMEWETSTRQATEISNLQAELARLGDKVKEKQQLLGEKARLDRSIQRMRAAVPSTPHMDILLMDLERLSDESDVDLIAVESPDLKDLKNKGQGNFMDSILQEMGGKLPLQLGKIQQQQTPAAGKPATPVANKPPIKVEPPVDPLGIQHMERRVFLTGDYNHLVDFLKRLESYERIVGIRDLIVAQPLDEDKDVTKTPASEKGKNLALDKPVMTFVMNVYYLP